MWSDPMVMSKVVWGWSSWWGFRRPWAPRRTSSRREMCRSCRIYSTNFSISSFRSNCLFTYTFESKWAKRVKQWKYNNVPDFVSDPGFTCMHRSIRKKITPGYFSLLCSVSSISTTNVQQLVISLRSGDFRYLQWVTEDVKNVLDQR